ncbi:hypothetical protein VB713_23330 [Anabaena cylindrica UHCC 0172]|uniref:hypothetical protein n=1 Tax=Anabaena cylindrica TaxID=1165 RepID=UPI002B2000BB|nr:hypothetical protein [Anabaena cylindrica]MEA5553876.1 hypothetical protein [Anabaena cylindrica UHCC 0172]
MRKQIIEYTSPLDALIALTKQLNVYEIKYQMSSEDFLTNIAKEKLLTMKCLSNGQEIISII